MFLFIFFKLLLLYLDRHTTVTKSPKAKPHSFPDLTPAFCFIMSNLFFQTSTKIKTIPLHLPFIAVKADSSLRKMTLHKKKLTLVTKKNGVARLHHDSSHVNNDLAPELNDPCREKNDLARAYFHPVRQQNGIAASNISD